MAEKPSTTRVTLTDRGVRALATRAPRMDVWDAVELGLHVRVSGVTGRKFWYYRYRVNGKHRRHKLGEFPGMSLAKARAAVRDVRGAVLVGEDPAAERAERKATDTSFRALAVEVLDRKATRTRERTRRERRRILDRELLPRWGEREAASITRREVVQLVEAIADRGAPTLANRVLAVVRLVYNDGIRRGFPGVEANPAHLVEPPGEEEGRDRYLDRGELRAVWEATEGEAVLIRAAFRLTFLTAQRIGSVLSMRWSDVAGDEWTIPADRFKGRRPHLVPLSAEARAVLERVPRLDGVDHLFPSRAASKRPHLTNVARALARIREASKIPHWTLHDARTTFRTWATRSASGTPPGLGVAPHVADHVLGHREQSLGFSKYQGDRVRYLVAEKREALSRWGAFVLAAVEEVAP